MYGAHAIGGGYCNVTVRIVDVVVFGKVGSFFAMYQRDLLVIIISEKVQVSVSLLLSPCDLYQLY